MSSPPTRMTMATPWSIPPNRDRAAESGRSPAPAPRSPRQQGGHVHERSELPIAARVCAPDRAPVWARDRVSHLLKARFRTGPAGGRDVGYVDAREAGRVRCEWSCPEARPGVLPRGITAPMMGITGDRGRVVEESPNRSGTSRLGTKGTKGTAGTGTNRSCTDEQTNDSAGCVTVNMTPLAAEGGPAPSATPRKRKKENVHDAIGIPCPYRPCPPR